MTLVWLVRHGRPRIDPDVHATAWPLAPDAAGEVARLRDCLPRSAEWFSSPEPKAIGTARLIADGPVTVVDDLREAVRPSGWVDDFQALVRRSVLEPEISVAAGWEPSGVTAARVTEVVRALVAGAAGSDVVLVGHGTAWTLLVASLTGRPPDLDAWAAMRMPDLAVLDVPATGPARIARAWDTGSCDDRPTASSSG